MKFATVIIVIVRAFQLAWPPLAYSVKDDHEAARLYAAVATCYVLFIGLVVAGMTLGGRWILRVLAAPAYFGAFEALPWVTLGWALYGLLLIVIVLAGRAQVTTRNLPAAVAGLAVNVLGLILLVGPLGIAGAGIALCAAYVVMRRAHVPAHAAGCSRVVRVGPARARGRGDRRHRGGGRAAAADVGRGRPGRTRVGVRGDPGRARGHRVPAGGRDAEAASARCEGGGGARDGVGAGAERAGWGLWSLVRAGTAANTGWVPARVSRDARLVTKRRRFRPSGGGWLLSQKSATT